MQCACAVLSSVACPALQYFPYYLSLFCLLLPTCPLLTSWSPLPAVSEVQPTSDVGTLMRRSYVVPMRWMVIYEYEVPGRALNLNSTKLPRPWSPWEYSPSRKNSHDRTGNRTRDPVISLTTRIRGWSHIVSQTARFSQIK
jgi:hypothetical protein